MCHGVYRVILARLYSVWLVFCQIVLVDKDYDIFRRGTKQTEYKQCIRNEYGELGISNQCITSTDLKKNTLFSTAVRKLSLGSYIDLLTYFINIGNPLPLQLCD